MARKPKVHPELTGDRCGSCNGTGTVIADLGGLNVETTCERCNGSGLEPK